MGLKALTDGILEERGGAVRRPIKWHHFVLTVEKLRWKKLTPETAAKISDANE